MAHMRNDITRTRMIQYCANDCCAGMRIDVEKRLCQMRTEQCLFAETACPIRCSGPLSFQL